MGDEPSSGNCIVDCHIYLYMRIYAFPIVFKPMQKVHKMYHIHWKNFIFAEKGSRPNPSEKSRPTYLLHTRTPYHPFFLFCILTWATSTSKSLKGWGRTIAVALYNLRCGSFYHRHCTRWAATYFPVLGLRGGEKRKKKEQREGKGNEREGKWEKCKGRKGKGKGKGRKGMGRWRKGGEVREGKWRKREGDGTGVHGRGEEWRKLFIMQSENC